MYKLMSNYYGQLSAHATKEEAIRRADGLKSKYQNEEFTVWANGEKVYTA
jgi:hypothetical protein